MTDDTKDPGMTERELYVHRRDERRVELVNVDVNATIGVALNIVQDEVVWLEDTDVELDVSLTIVETGLPHRGHVHVNRCHQIMTTVTYNGEPKEHTFHPSTRVELVFEWAVSKEGFNLTPVDAAEHELKLTGSEIKPDPSDHIGSFANDHCAVAFSLLPKIRHEG